MHVTTEVLMTVLTLFSWATLQAQALEPDGPPFAASVGVRELLDSATQSPSDIPRIRLELWNRFPTLGPAEKEETAAILLQRANESQQEVVRRFAIESLGALGAFRLSESSKSAGVSFLLETALSENTDPFTRIAAVFALPKLETDEVVMAGLHQVILQSADRDQGALAGRQSIVESAIRALGTCGSREAAGHLIECWDDRDLRDSFEETILTSLAHTGDPRAQSLLVNWIAGSDKRSNAAVAKIQALGGLARIILSHDELSSSQMQRVAEIRQLLRTLCDQNNHPEVFATAAVSLARAASLDDQATTDFLKSVLPKLAERDRHVVESVLQYQSRTTDKAGGKTKTPDGSH